MAEPLIAALPRALSPLRGLARRAVLGRMERFRRGGLLLELPDGDAVRFGDPRAPARVARVADDRAFLRILLRGEMGAGESYVAGEWDSDELAEVIAVFLHNTGARGMESPLTTLARLPELVRHLARANSRAGSRRNIGAHYDLGNDFYRLFLDPSMTYSCALWDGDGDTLERAQARKLDRLFDLLELDADDHLLDIGCGWGGLAIRAARERGCRVTGITVSAAQLALARERVAEAGLTERIDLRLCDYRDTDGRYDKIASVEMLEAVGYQFLPAFFARVAELLRSGGRAAVQTIWMPDARFRRYRRSVDWTQTYIFPGSLIPSLQAIGDALAPAGLRVRDHVEIGPSYAPTLREWRRRFHAALPAVRALGFDEPFVRTWTLYLAFSEAAFGARTLGDAQLVIDRAR